MITRAFLFLTSKLCGVQLAFTLIAVVILATPASSISAAEISTEQLSDWLRSISIGEESSLSKDQIFSATEPNPRDSRFSFEKGTALLGALLLNDEAWAARKIKELSESKLESDKELAEWLIDDMSLEAAYKYLSYTGRIAFPIELFRLRPDLLEHTYYWGSSSDFFFQVSSSDGLHHSLGTEFKNEATPILFQIRGQDRSCNTGTMEVARYKSLAILRAYLDAAPETFIELSRGSQPIDIDNHWIGIWKFGGAYERNLSNSLSSALINDHRALSELIARVLGLDSITASRIANGYLTSVLILLTEAIPSRLYKPWGSKQEMFEAFQANDIDRFIDSREVEVLRPLAIKNFLEGATETATAVLSAIPPPPFDGEPLSIGLVGQDSKIARKYLETLSMDELLVQNRFYKSLAMLAAQYNDLPTLEYLLKRAGPGKYRGLTRKNEDFYGCIPQNLNRGVLSYAAENASADLIRRALETFPDQINIPDDNGLLPSDYIRSNSLVSEAEKADLLARLK